MIEKAKYESKFMAISLGTLNEYSRALQHIRYKELFPDKSMCNSRARDGHDRSKEFGFIPFSVRETIGVIIRIKYAYPTMMQNRYPLFLDAGCGMGNIMAIAHAAGFRVSGIERDITTYKYATKFTKNFGKVYRANMVTFKDYGKYDVIYYYVPIKDHNLMHKCAERIAEQMKIGAIIIPIAYDSPFRSKPEIFKQIPDTQAFEKIAEYKSPKMNKGGK